MKTFYTLFLLLALATSSMAETPPLLLLEKPTESIPNNWVMSEKLDGIRAYWDGQKLWSRGGVQIHPPAWFTQHFPPFEMDGELWIGRGQYEKVQNAVMDRQPSSDWKQVGYWIFELPNQPGGLLARLATLDAYLAQYPIAHLHRIDQHPVKSRATLEEFNAQILAQGGEGLVVRDPTQAYTTGRSSHALKIKPTLDDECRVTGYREGKGKYSAMTGALICTWRNAQGKPTQLKIGSGLTDAQRQTPPAIGQTITFSYQGLTAKGLPRHPVFLRERPIQ